MVIYGNLTNTQQYMYTYIHICKYVEYIYIEEKVHFSAPKFSSAEVTLLSVSCGHPSEDVLCMCKHVCNSHPQFCSHK